MAEHLRALIRQDLANAAACLQPPPAAPEAQRRTVLQKSNRVPTPAAERFWAKVDKRGEDECWEWKAARSKANYGSFDGCFGTAAAHRIAWMLANNAEVPPGMVMMHLCDNPPCCNPKHLRPGTYAENATDRAAKDRGRRPSVTNVTYDQAMAYRERIIKGELNQSEVAAETGLSLDVVSRMIRGKTLTADFKRLPQDDVRLPLRLKRSAVRQAIEKVLAAQGGLLLDEVTERASQWLPSKLRNSVTIVYLKAMRKDGEVVFTGRRIGRPGKHGGKLPTTTLYYLPGTVPEGAYVRPYGAQANSRTAR
jgi:hypothetical protein